MKKFLSVCGICLALGACVSGAGYDHYLKRFVGKSEADLVSVWGAPTQLRTLSDGSQLLVYTRQKTVMRVDDNFGNYSVYNNTNELSVDEKVSFCETTFTTKNNTVVGYSWVGDACAK